MGLETYLRAAPKAELHVHLEGSIGPATLLTLAHRNGVSLPADDVAGLNRWFTFRDFDHFVEIYIAISRCLKTIDDYALIVHEFGAEMARQNVRYAEVTFTAGSHHGRGIPEAVFLGGIARGREQARRDFGVQINWVFDVDRWADDAAADYTVGVAIDSLADGVVALGLGGPEVGHPPEDYARYFARARAAGLHSAPHGGETVGPASVWGAMRALEAERVGPGVRAIEDPTLVAELARRGIPLEVSPTSNLRLGVYPNIAAHPLRRLHDAGVVVTVNSDDPALFNTTLNDEAALLDTDFGFEPDACDEILLNAVRHSFLPADERVELEREFVAELVSLRKTHGLA
jgi:aminodeoxyfutalosine deaminase